MACLHLIGSEAGLEACLPLSGDGDALVLLGDGCYAACRAERVARHPALRWFALDDDLVARGLAARRQPPVAPIDHGGLVELVVEYPRCVSWR